jgi:hypothetical protein
MRGSSTLMKLRMLFDVAVVTVSVVVSFVTGVVVPAVLIAVLVVFGGGLTYLEHTFARLQSESESLTTVIEEDVLSELVQEYEDIHPDSDPPEIRTNVMFLRRRNLPFSDNDRRDDVWPWQETLRIEATHGDYASTSEDELEWKTDEGVVGRAMNESAQEIWATLDYDDRGRIKKGWNLTERQVAYTSDIKSLLCVPIYLPSDEEKKNPVGVLNVDCKEPLTDSRFGDEEIRQRVIKSANVIGAIVE